MLVCLSFRPDSELYLESLGIICSVPAAWLICTLVILLIYLLTRCCDTKNNKVRANDKIIVGGRCGSVLVCSGFCQITKPELINFWPGAAPNRRLKL